MKVVVTQVYAGRTRMFEGTDEQVRKDLYEAYGSAMLRFRVPPEAPLADVVEAIDGQQAYSVQVQHEAMKKSEGNLLEAGMDGASEIVQYMLGFQPQLEATFAAARFLSGGAEVPLDQVRRVLWEEDGDLVRAALRSYNLSDTDENREALKAVRGLGGLAKNDSTPPLSSAVHVEPGTSEAAPEAEAVTRSARAGNVSHVSLGGKHSKGMMLARDPGTEHLYLLKPGSGGQSPAAGARQDQSTQSQREAAFWAVASFWGLKDNLPKAELLVIDGKQYACMRLLPFEYKPLEKLRDQSPSVPARRLEPYRHRGLLHRWAVLDFVLGNPDRHAGNVMSSPSGDVKLIDHGSAFAGAGFDPAYDKNSFVPYYLRYGAPANVSFNTLPMEEKLRYLVSAPAEVRPELAKWVNGLHSGDLENILPRFGIDPRSAIERLSRVRSIQGSVDEGINALWAGT